MMRSDIDDAIRLHNKWRRQFVNAFAGGNYADMPLSEHRSCTFFGKLSAAIANPAGPAIDPKLLTLHQRFHNMANEIVDLSQNGLGDAADLLLPEFNEVAHQLTNGLDELRATLPA